MSRERVARAHEKIRVLFWEPHCFATKFRPTYQSRETPDMGQLIGERKWETLHHGWKWADAVSDMGYVCNDGRMLVAQPHLDLDPSMIWTLDYLRRMPHIESPNVLLNQWSDAASTAFAAHCWRGGPAGWHPDAADRVSQSSCRRSTLEIGMTSR